MFAFFRQSIISIFRKAKYFISKKNENQFTTMNLLPLSVGFFLGGGSVQGNTGECYCPRRVRILFLSTKLSAVIQPCMHQWIKVSEARQVTDTSKMDRSDSCPSEVHQWDQGRSHEEANVSRLQEPCKRWWACQAEEREKCHNTSRTVAVLWSSHQQHFLLFWILLS